MRGTVSPIASKQVSNFLEILVEKEFYSIGRFKFKRPTDIELEVFTDEILECFAGLIKEVKRPEIENLVRTTPGNRFTLLGRTCNLTNDPVGDDLLKYIYKANHNMLHFACHCKQSNRGDSLLVSFLQDEEIAEKALVLELETHKFLLRRGKFLCQPLVFLNACQSAGGTDDLRRTFNLPKKFIQHDAAAVIATACPVPALFAAAFAKVFYQYFLRGMVVEDEVSGEKIVKIMSIGEALRATRWYFLKEFNNPLGLAYGVYSPASYRVRSRMIAK